MKQLRNYQKECLETIESSFKRLDRQLIQLPTGAGKTFVFLNYLKRNSERSLVLVPTLELKEQIIDEASKILDCAVYGKRGIDKKGLHVLTVQAMRNGFEDFYKNFETLVIDEAHHGQAETYKRLINCFKGKILGVTATPERADGLNLLDIFHELTYKKNVLELIKAGYLCDIEAHKIKTGIDLKNNSFVEGDFSQTLLKSLDLDSRNRIIFDVYQKHCRDSKCLIFCLGVDHAIKMSQYLQSEGIEAEAIYGRLPKEERKAIIKRFKEGKTRVLLNCQLLTEGFDEPSIESIIIARPTRSKALYCQMVGRGLRLHKGKEHLKLFELADNNHKICTFNVMAGKEVSDQRDYKPGMRLTNWIDEIDKISIEDVEIHIEKFKVYEDFLDENALWHQVDELKRRKINFFEPISFKEAAFLIWKDNLKRKYGFV